MLQLHSSILRLKHSLCLSMKKRFSVVIVILKAFFSFRYIFFFFSLIVLVESMRDVNSNKGKFHHHLSCFSHIDKKRILLNIAKSIIISSERNEMKMFYLHTLRSTKLKQINMRWDTAANNVSTFFLLLIFPPPHWTTDNNKATKCAMVRKLFSLSLKLSTAVEKEWKSWKVTSEKVMRSEETRVEIAKHELYRAHTACLLQVRSKNCEKFDGKFLIGKIWSFPLTAKTSQLKFWLEKLKKV